MRTFYGIVFSPSGKERKTSIYALNFASLHFRMEYQSRIMMVKNIVRVLVSHKQLLGFYNISLFNFVTFSLSGKPSACHITPRSAFWLFSLELFHFVFF